jgi:adenylate cyclase
LIGSTAPGLMDLKPTPMSEFGPYPGVEIVATALENIVRARPLTPVGEGYTWLFMTLLSLLIGVLSWTRPGIGWNSLFTFGVLALYWGGSLYLLSAERLSLPIAAPVLSGFTAGLFALGWQYFSEGQDRKRIRELFGNYVAAPVVKKLLDDPASLQLGGERREMSVFFSDIAGYTDISESLTPEALVSQLNEYLSEVGKPILRREGYIDKYIGDAVMAIFGAPVAQKDKELQAVLAALELQEALAPMQDLWRARSMPPLPTRIGIATGYAVLGNIGSSQRVNYTAIGDTVNLAARLEGANKHFGTSILIDGATAANIAKRVRIREVGTVAVKGKKKGVRVFEPLCEVGKTPIYSEAFITAYSSVVDCFRERKFEECVRAADEALSIRPDDVPSGMYKDMGEEYMLCPPGDDFDATVRLKTK